VAQITAPDPDLSESQLVALELADALMTDPGGVTDDLRTRIHERFTRAQMIELALDVMKWSYQKVPVALGTDDLVFDADGHWVRPST
jgi:hypothetical protein